jgi:ribosomal protein S18 acetylase RimI-like enzyme
LPREYFGLGSIETGLWAKVDAVIIAQRNRSTCWSAAGELIVVWDIRVHPRAQGMSVGRAL